MILQVVDANGVLQTVCAQAPETPSDKSGTITVNNATQVLMDPAAPGVTRSGWIVQNNGASGDLMFINDLGSDADTSPTSVQLAHGQFWPPPGYPVPQGQISIAGTAGDSFMAREW
jgi:hypothetical protein